MADGVVAAKVTAVLIGRVRISATGKYSRLIFKEMSKTAGLCLEILLPDRREIRIHLGFVQIPLDPSIPSGYHPAVQRSDNRVVLKFN